MNNNLSFLHSLGKTTLVKTLAAASVVTLMSASSVVLAQTVVYDNTVNFSASGATNGGAVAGNLGVGTAAITYLVADDLGYNAAYGGYGVSGFKFSVANFNSTAKAASPLVRFYNSDGAGSGPGTFLYGINFSNVTVNAGSVSTFTYSAVPNGSFVLPSSGLIWAGISFTNLNNAGTGANATTAAQLNNIGQGLYNPPTVGSSQNVFFETNNPGSFASNNPTGGFYNFTGGTPYASFGWQITVATPEPGVNAMLTAGVLSIAGPLLRRRRNAKKRA